MEVLNASLNGIPWAGLKTVEIPRCCANCGRLHYFIGGTFCDYFAEYTNPKEYCKEFRYVDDT